MIDWVVAWQAIYNFLISNDLWSRIYGLLVSPLPVAMVGLYGLKIYKGNELWKFKVERHVELLKIVDICLRDSQYIFTCTHQLKLDDINEPDFPSFKGLRVSENHNILRSAASMQNYIFSNSVISAHGKAVDCLTGFIISYFDSNFIKINNSNLSDFHNYNMLCMNQLSELKSFVIADMHSVLKP